MANSFRNRTFYIRVFELPWGSAQTQSLIYAFISSCMITSDLDRARVWRHWLKILFHAKTLAVALGVVHASIERGFDPHLQIIRSIPYSPGQLCYSYDTVRGRCDSSLPGNGSSLQRAGAAVGGLGAGTPVDPRAVRQDQSGIGHLTRTG